MLLGKERPGKRQSENKQKGRGRYGNGRKEHWLRQESGRNESVNESVLQDKRGGMMRRENA